MPASLARLLASPSPTFPLPRSFEPPAEAPSLTLVTHTHTQRSLTHRRLVRHGDAVQLAAAVTIGRYTAATTHTTSAAIAWSLPC